MSITIRLSRVGKRNAPAYKIVVMNSRDKRYGKFLDVLGHYNPSENPESYALNEDKFKEWIGKGAGVTTAVELLREGKYVHKPYTPNKKKGESSSATTATENEDSSAVETETQEMEAEAVTDENTENIEINEEVQETGE